MPTRIYGPKQRYIKPAAHYQLTDDERAQIENLLANKKPVMEYQATFRFSEEDKARLDTIKQRYGISESDALWMALRYFADLEAI